MGCGSSSIKNVAQGAPPAVRSADADQGTPHLSRNDPVIDAPRSISVVPVPPHPVKVTMGTNVLPCEPDREQFLAFLFGGNGAMKGQLASYLCSVHGFALLSLENMLFQVGRDELVKQAVANGGGGTAPDADSFPLHEVIAFLAKDSTTMYVEIALRRIVVILNAAKGGGTVRKLVIDMIPNHLPLAESTMMRDLPKVLARFQRTELKADMAFMLAKKLASNPGTPSSEQRRMSSRDIKTASIRRKGSLNDEANPEQRARRSHVIGVMTLPLLQMFTSAGQLVTVTVPEANRSMELALRLELDKLMARLFPHERQEHLSIDIRAGAPPATVPFKSTRSTVVTLADLGIAPDPQPSWPGIVDAVTETLGQNVGAGKQWHPMIHLCNVVPDFPAGWTKKRGQCSQVAFIENFKADADGKNYLFMLSERLHISLPKDLNTHVAANILKLFQTKLETAY